MNNLGALYENGEGVEKDYDKAFEWYATAAEMGNADAMYSLGHMYEQGLGTKQDAVSAADWYRKAREAGYSD